jgi:heme/copper-type cytochrome/quinol oxidase subunit 2
MEAGAGFGMMMMFFLVIAIALLVINIITSVWAYRDAKSKGKSNEYALLVLIATLIFPILGLIVYLIIRHD